ncbi:MAG: divergent polysaccharide deacetylase family protein [Rhodothalassiaceae bacterium]
MAIGTDQATASGGGRAWTLLKWAWAVTVVAVAAAMAYLQFSYEPARTTPIEAAPAPEASAIAMPDVSTPAQTGPEARSEARAQARAEAAPTQTPAQRPRDRADLAADPRLLQAGPFGPLPTIAADGTRPLDVYAQPAAASGGPMIAIVLMDVGLAQDSSRRAVEEAPEPVTLAISPYARQSQDWADQARLGGHEVLVMVPAEPETYPEDDPGPHTLLVDQSSAINKEKLYFVMSRFSGYVGLINHMGSRFTTSRDSLRPILQDLSTRGVMVVDARTTRFSAVGRIARELGVPYAINNRNIDEVPDAGAIDDKLANLEDLARSYGAVVGIGRPYPVTIDRLQRWHDELASRGVTLVPISAVASRQEVN